MGHYKDLGFYPEGDGKLVEGFHRSGARSLWLLILK